jgi:hypothetical protein
VLFLSGLVASPAAAQVVRGVVLDAETGKPVARAVVHLFHADSVQVSGFLTGEDGRFLLTTPREGIHVLDVEHAAYGVSRTASLDVSHGNAVDVEIRLAPVAIKLDPLTVVGRRTGVLHENTIDGFHARAATFPAVGPFRAMTRTNSRDFAESLDVRSLLHNFPMTRCNAPMILFNGWLLLDKEGTEQMMSLSTGYLEGVEYYRTYDMVPFGLREYFRHGEAVRKCGALVLWPRRTP